MTDERSDPIKAARARDWDEVARLLPTMQDDAIFAVTRMALPPLLDAVEVQRGARVLDAGCGPGLLAELALERGLDLLGIDLSPGMVAEARARFPAAAFQVGDSEALPVADASVDAVVCNFAINGLPRPEQAAREALRVLAPGRRYAFTTWCEHERNDLFRLSMPALSRHVPDADGRERRTWSVDECHALLAAAGFDEVRATVTSLHVRARNPQAVLELAWSTGRLLRMLRDQTSDVRARVEADILAAAAAQSDHGGIPLEMPIVLATGRRPIE